jgi:hypothetical protein
MKIADRVTITSAAFLPHAHHNCHVFATVEYADGASYLTSCVIAKSLKPTVDTLLGKPIEKGEMQTWAKANPGRFTFQKFLRQKVRQIAGRA